MRPNPSLVGCAFLLASLLPLAESAFAQSTTCKALQDELTALNRQNGGRANSFAEAAQRQIDEMQRISAYMRQIG